MKKLHVYIVHRCELTLRSTRLIKESRVIDVYLDRESAVRKVRKLESQENAGYYYCILKKSLKGEKSDKLQRAYEDQNKVVDEVAWNSLVNKLLGKTNE